MKLEIGQTIYGCGYKIKRISFCYDLITGMKVMKIKIKSIGKKYLTLDLGSGDKQKISRKRLGRSIFLTEKEIVNYIINETKRRIKEKEAPHRKQEFDIEHLRYLKKDLKKWIKYTLDENTELTEKTENKSGVKK